jgi:hypothetical protein
LPNIRDNIKLKHLNKNGQNLEIIFIFERGEETEILYSIYKIDKNLFNIYIIFDDYFKNIYSNYYYINSRSQYDFHSDNTNDIPKTPTRRKLFIAKTMEKNIGDLYLKNI